MSNIFDSAYFHKELFEKSKAYVELRIKYDLPDPSACWEVRGKGFAMLMYRDGYKEGYGDAYSEGFHKGYAKALKKIKRLVRLNKTSVLRRNAG